MRMGMYLDFVCKKEKEGNGNILLIINFIIASVGIVGNLISISILVKKEFRETFHRLLLSLAGCDLLYVLSVVIRECLRGIRNNKSNLLYQLNSTLYRNSENCSLFVSGEWDASYNSTGDALYNSTVDAVYNCTEEGLYSYTGEQKENLTRIFELSKEVDIWADIIDIFSFLLRYMYFASIYFIVSISCERYFGVCYPIQSRIKGKTRFYMYLFQVIILSFFIECPQMIVVLKHIWRLQFSKEEEQVFTVWFDYIKPFFTIYLPLFLLVLLNIRIFFTVKNSRKSLRTNCNNNTAERERNFLRILVSIVFLFLFTHSLRVLDQIYRESTDKILQHCKQMNQFPVIPSWLRTMNLMVEPAGLINASLNFIIYCLAGTRFRTVLIRSARSTFRSSPVSSRTTETFALTALRNQEERRLHRGMLAGPGA